MLNRRTLVVVAVCTIFSANAVFAMGGKRHKTKPLSPAPIKFEVELAPSDTIIIATHQDPFSSNRCELGSVVVGNDNKEPIRCQPIAPGNYTDCNQIDPTTFYELFRTVNVGSSFNQEISNIVAKRGNTLSELRQLHSPLATISVEPWAQIQFPKSALGLREQQALQAIRLFSLTHLFKITMRSDFKPCYAQQGTTIEFLNGKKEQIIPDEIVLGKNEKLLGYISEINYGGSLETQFSQIQDLKQDGSRISFSGKIQSVDTLSDLTGSAQQAEQLIQTIQKPSSLLEWQSSMMALSGQISKRPVPISFKIEPFSITKEIAPEPKPTTAVTPSPVPEPTTEPDILQ